MKIRLVSPSPSPTVTLLRRVPWLADVPPRELDDIGRRCDELVVDAGSVLMTQGAYDASVMLIVEGTAQVMKHGTTVASVGAGEIIGEVAAIDRRPRTATVVAETPMRLLVVAPRDTEVFLAHPAVSRAMLTKMARRFRTDPTLAA